MVWQGPKGDWADIGAPKKNGTLKLAVEQNLKKIRKENTSSAPRATANRMTKAQIRSAAQRKRAAGNPGGNQQC